MATVLGWGLLNAILATCLALFVAAFSWTRPRPAVLHILWSLVLVRLLLPAMNAWPLALPLPAVIPAIADHKSEHAAEGDIAPRSESPSREATMPFGPRKGEKYTIPAKKKVKFTVAKAAKDSITGSGATE